MKYPGTWGLGLLAIAYGLTAVLHAAAPSDAASSPAAPPLASPPVVVPAPAPPPAAVAPAAGGKLECKAPDYDFGSVDNTREMEHEYVLRNSGTAAVTIRRVTASCGCTATTVSTNVITPGMEARVKAVLNLRGRTGRQEKSIQVESNDPANPVLRLWLRGNATTELTAEPLFLNFGEMDGETEIAKPVKITSRQAGVSITNVFCDSKAFAVAPWPKSDPRGLGVDVRTVPPVTSDHVYGKVTIQTDHATARELNVQVFGVVRGEVMVVPKEIVLRRNTVGPLTRSILIRSGSVKSYQVLSAKIPGADVEVIINNQGAGSYRIDVRNIRGVRELEGRSLEITTDLTKNKEILIPVRVID